MPCQWGLPCNHQISQIVNVLWEWGIEGAPSLFFLIWRLLEHWFHHDFMLLVYHTQGSENTTHENDTGFSVLSEIPPFFLNKFFLLTANLWLLYRIIKTILILIIFPVFLFLLKKQYFLGLFLASFAYITPIHIHWIYEWV